MPFIDLSVPGLRVKTCGIATFEDAARAVAAGSDGVGLLVGLDHASPDELTMEAAASIARTLPASVSPVIVTHRVRPDHIVHLVHGIGAACVQLHAEVRKEDISELRKRLPGTQLIKALHPEDASAVDDALGWAEHVDAIVLDTRADGRIGGTGRTHDWGLSASVVQALPGFPVLLAGGLTPDNVGEAVERVRPWGVDVNSGVRASPGRKDPERLVAFVREARAAPSMKPATHRSMP